jgi:glycosyltransferase involved in cell wall biosynthesis
MSFPTITLALIAKNEEKNINRLLDSVEGCFDEIVFVDTGSTDKTKQIAIDRGCVVYDFTWVNSFCKARNFAFSKTTCDYILWLDLDDCLSDKEAFIQWKNYAMAYADCWFATYHYALDKDKKPIISFVRERVFKRSIDPVWQYDLHEGIIIKPEWSRDYATPWSVLHMRDEQDVIADKSRNIKILDDIKARDGDLPTRLKFYYGKELYENGNPQKAIWAFEEVLKCSDLEFHDRVLAYQYASYSAFQCAQHIKEENKQEIMNLLNLALNFAIEGIKIEPSRAEFFVTCGDIYLFQGQLHKAVGFYGAAKTCVNPKELSGAYEGAVYSFIDCYGLVPSIQLAKCYFNMGKIDQAKKEAQDCFDKYQSPSAKEIITEIEKIENLVKLDNGQVQTEDIVITCPPQTAYPFDEELYKTKGLGGSETALIQMARHLHELTGRAVKVFNMREEDLVADSGVEYISNKKLNEYMSKNLPFVHIAWRHNIKLTNAKTYLWCHDLTTATVEQAHNFDKMICLSEFHKNYVRAKQNVPADKIFLSRNGIDTEKFQSFERKDKDLNKIVWMSSPDRGLEQCILIMDELTKIHCELKLHVYYGLDNLYKYGLGAMADKLKQMIEDRPWVIYHGFTEQAKMYEEVSDAVIWLHPCNFIETFCITALEMLELEIFPVTRKLGALANTLELAESKGEAILLDHNGSTKEQIAEYVEAVQKVLEDYSWQDIYLETENYSWKSVAKEWIKEMQL